MQIEIFVLGDFATNCYLVRKNNSARDCFVIDPGLDSSPLIQKLEQSGLAPDAVFLTHGHIDHIAGVEAVRIQCPKVKVYIHAEDANMLTSAERNLSAFAGTMFQSRPADVIIDSQAHIELAGISFELLHVPGHTPGGLCLYNSAEKLVFVGDALFAGSIGRTDFPDGDGEQLITRIKQKLMTLPGDTKVYPGHGPATTIQNEARYNPFLS